jgi:transposase-like protein
MAFVVALGLDTSGQKRALGFWEGATENAPVGKTLPTPIIFN